MWLDEPVHRNANVRWGRHVRSKFARHDRRREPVTIHSCDPQVGAVHTAAPSGTECGSSDVCAGAFVCDGASSCTQAPPATVDDGNPCTADSCNPQAGVSHTPLAEGSACADNLDKCVGAYTCDANATCVQGSAPTVDDGNPCTTDACDPGTGVSHTPLPTGSACADNSDLCIGAYTCDSNTACNQGPAPVVDDGNICTVDACNPSTGVSHTPIQGCDSSPTTGNGVFETQASLLGEVIDGSGNGVTGASFRVYDLPAHALRSDAQLVAGSSGDFRIRLTQFPTTEGAAAAASSPARGRRSELIPAYRDAYAHPGTAYDFGPIEVMPYDSNVTNIGPEGGTASDSQNRVTVVIPPGALTSTIPVQVTPFVQRDELPSPLPDSTVTMYGFDLAPSGTTFAVPVSVTLSNWRSVPTNIAIPVGYFDETSGEWEHMASATWNGSAFTFTTSHFSILDANAARNGQNGDLLVYYGDGVNPNTSAQVCGGSSIGVSNGSVEQNFSLPVYQDRSTPYGVTLNYNSGLAGSRPLASSSQTNRDSTAVGSTHVSVAVQSSLFGAVCVPRGSSGSSGAPGACSAGSCSLGGSTVSYSVQSYFGSGSNKTDADLAAGTKAMDVGAWVDLPSDSNGDPIGSSFITQHAVLEAGGTGACVSGGGTFGVSDLGTNPQQTSLDPGPVASIDRHVFVHPGTTLLLGRAGRWPTSTSSTSTPTAITPCSSAATPARKSSGRGRRIAPDRSSFRTRRFDSRRSLAITQRAKISCSTITVS